MRRVHFIGIGGVGMNGLAQLAALSGYSVSGSDRGYDPGTQPFRALEQMGVRMVPQDGSGLSPDIHRVVYSTAIEPDNLDLVQSEKLRIPLLHRAAFLKELIGDDKLIAVAGTAGKTTTAGLLGWIFEYLGEDPSVYNGAAVLNWRTDTYPGNIRKGRSELWIIEADESDRSFLQFHPDHSIITNISRDHYELDELHSMFDRFESQTSGITVRGQSYNLMLNEFKTLNYRTDPPLMMIGKHNQENALCAFTLCVELGFDPERVMVAIACFKGIERRLETVGVIQGITVLDDYAHNPAKIAASISAVTEAFEKAHVFWRPHGFTPLYQNRDELIKVFKQAGPASLFILPVYYAGGSVERKMTSSELVGQLNSSGVPARLVQDYDTLKRELEECARSGDAILGMGARDPKLPIFARSLIEKWTTS